MDSKTGAELGAPPPASPGVAASSARRALLRRLLGCALPVAAIAFVIAIVPIRDRCFDPAAPASTKVAVTRDDGKCILHLKSGDVAIDAAECAKLKCDPGLGATLTHARGGQLAGLLGIYLVSTILWAARWRVLLRLADVRPSLVHVWRVLVESQAVGMLLPGAIGGDALRVAKIARGSTVGVAIASVMVDRAIGLTMIAVVAMIAAYGFGGGLPGSTGYILAAIPLSFVIGVAALRSARVRQLWILREGRVARAFSPIIAMLANDEAIVCLVKSAGLSIAGAVVQFFILRGILSALGAVPTDESWIFVGIALSMMAAAIPALPGGWGTGDAAFVFFFGLSGVPPAEAFGVSLVYRAFWYVLGILGGIINVLPRREPQNA